jgi:hypothetical protein
MACPNPSYLKQSLGQMPSLQNHFSSKKPFFFPLTSQKYIYYLSISFPAIYFVTYILKLTFIRILNLL